ncbi:MAG: hypothetical protein AB1626_05685 [Candidatus Micrarchaeota archaeon]
MPLFEKPVKGISFAYRLRQRLSAGGPTHPIERIGAKVTPVSAYEVIPGTALLSHVTRRMRSGLRSRLERAGLPAKAAELLSFRPGQLVRYEKGGKPIFSKPALRRVVSLLRRGQGASRGQLLALVVRR